MELPTVFVSYSHKDEVWKDRLVSQLNVAGLEGQFATWQDRLIAGGDDWFHEIRQAIEAASIAVLLVSADFLNSEFIRTHEVPRLLQRREADGVRLIPLL